MQIDDFKIFAKNEKKKQKIETLIENIRIYSQYKGMEFGLEKHADNEK